MRPMPFSVANSAPEAAGAPQMPASAPSLSLVWNRGRLQVDGRASQVAALEAVWLRSGGLASADQMVRLLRANDLDQPLSRLARWIVAREVVSYEWKGETWLPLFQFNRVEMSLRPEVGAVIRELSGVFDDWDLASWFTAPNTWLGGLTPIDAISTLPQAVKEAARVDRFVACG